LEDCFGSFGPAEANDPSPTVTRRDEETVGWKLTTKVDSDTACQLHAITLTLLYHCLHQPTRKDESNYKYTKSIFLM